ncbi:AAA family ATPase [Parabacteroides sp. FAFU027]|uniref:AAA family ATPase n=1 Tax=Parabacteroides sp. FAFU027 TaxID=2922715 RepID=UPI001FAFB037|nr:AAA family ATPase [Parabacteroides sp. FAFU027]
MKIIRIELQNINSLKSASPVEIDFEGEKFRGVGLFGITGPTGAGKTTILDAITIALYHDVPRFNQSQAATGLVDVVSRGAEDAFTRVTFETNDAKYEAFWSIRLTRKGGVRLTKPIETVQLKNLTDGTIIAEKKSEKEQKIEEITQLNYKQFLRSVMLAQGEFAAFLSAKQSEKGALLEQITGQEIYKKIGEAVRSRINAESSSLDAIKSKINNADLLTEEQRTELTSRQVLLNDEVKASDTLWQEANRMVAWYEAEEKLTARKQQLAARQVELTTRSEQLQPELLALETHQKAEPFKPLITELQRTETELQRKQERNRQLLQQQEEQSVQLKNADGELQQKQSAHQTAEEHFRNWQPQLDKVTQLDTELRSIGEQITRTGDAKKADAQALDLLQKNISTKQSVFTQYQAQLKEVEAFLQSEKDLPEIETSLAEWVKHFSIRSQLAMQQVKTVSRLEENGKLLQSVDEQIAKLLAEYSTRKTQLAESQTKEKSLAETLEKHPLEQYLKQKDEWVAKQALFGRLQQISASFLSLSQQKKELDEGLKVQMENQKTLQSQQKRQQEALGNAKALMQKSEQILELESRIKSYEEERKKLVEGEPCALCGSTVHPYVKQYAGLELTATQKQVAEEKALVEKRQNELNAISANVAAVQARIESGTTQSAQLAAQQAQLEADFQAGNVSFAITDKETLAAGLVEANQALQTLEGQIAGAQQLQKEREKLQSDIQTLSNEFADITNNGTELRGKQSALKQQLETDQKEAERLQSELAIVVNQLTESIDKYGFALPQVEETESFIASLQKRISQYKEQSTLQNKLLTDIHTLAAELKSQGELAAEKETALQQLQKQYDELTVQFTEKEQQRISILPKELSVEKQREELTRQVQLAQQQLKSATDQRSVIQEKLLATRTELETLSKDSLTQKENYDTLQQQLAAQLSDTPFLTRAAVEEALLSDERKRQLDVLKKQLDDTALELITLEKQRQSESDSHLQNKNFEQSAEEALAQKQQCEADRGAMQKQLGEITERFRKDGEIQLRNQEVVEKINAQEKVVRKWESLYSRLGGSKDSFNTYIQRLTLKHLIRLANHHLSKLNNRYSLYMGDKYKAGEELQFVLIDHDQTDEMRYVETSSGGEKFLISLALALGLSDIASRNVRIGSLFIDEGFGTLDANTLETVIATLETLQSQGKMIGIISHVDSLKERIPTQIVVKKRSNGVSAVEIV